MVPAEKSHNLWSMLSPYHINQFIFHACFISSDSSDSVLTSYTSLLVSFCVSLEVNFRQTPDPSPNAIPTRGDFRCL